MATPNEIESLIKDIQENPDKIEELTDEQIVAVRNAYKPFGMTKDIKDRKYLVCSVINMREEYMMNLMTTAMIGFLYKAVSEYKISTEEEENELFIRRESAINIKYEDIQKKIRDTMHEKLAKAETDEQKKLCVDEYEVRVERSQKRKQVELDELSMEKDNYKGRRKVVTDFLNDTFTYDPNIHVASAYNREKALLDADRKNGVEDIEKKEKLEGVKKILYDHIPPREVYANFKFYYNANYDNLNEATQTLYQDKKDIGLIVNPYDIFDTSEDAEKFVNKNRDCTITDIVTLSTYSWNILGPFRKNRERITFYNDNTKILEQLLKQKEEDSKLGADLMKKRVKVKKQKNIEQFGPDDPLVKKNVMNTAEGLGAEHISKEEKYEEAIKKYEERKRKEDILKQTDDVDNLVVEPIDVEAEQRTSEKSLEDRVKELDVMCDTVDLIKNRKKKEEDSSKEHVEFEDKEGIPVRMVTVDAGKQTVSESEFYTEST